ncbi:MAG: creatininase family protein [Bauldia sp.]
MLNLAEAFPRDIDRHLAEHAPILVQPLGTIEWHSHHLPLGLDGIVAERLSRAIAEQADAVLAPVSWWAVGGVPFPHTLKLPLALIEPLLVELYVQFGGMGFAVVLAFAGHFGLEQTLAMKRAALTAMRRTTAFILPLTEYDTVTDMYAGDHAGLGEASLLLSFRPELVHLDAVPLDAPLPGVLGPEPRGHATADHGRRIAEAIAARSAKVAHRLLDSAGDRRRYADVLELCVEVMEATLQLRRSGDSSSAPPIGTPAWLAHCAALTDGDYDAAQAHLRTKRSDLWR